MRFERNVDESFTSHLRPVGDAGAHILFLEFRVVLQNVSDALAFREKRKDQRHPDARSTDARLSATARRVNPDPLKEFLAGESGVMIRILPQKTDIREAVFKPVV